MVRLGFPPNPKKNNYRNPDAIEKVVHYPLKKEKTPHAITGAIGVNGSDEKKIIDEMTYIQKYFNKDKGKRMIHFWISFSTKEMAVLDYEDYRHIGYIVADFFENQYQLVFGLHEDTKHAHIHFAVNPVNYCTGKKYHWQKSDTRLLKTLINQTVTDIINRKLYD